MRERERERDRPRGERGRQTETDRQRQRHSERARGESWLGWWPGGLKWTSWLGSDRGREVGIVGG